MLKTLSKFKLIENVYSILIRQLSTTAVTFQLKPNISNLSKIDRVLRLREMALPNSRPNPCILKLTTEQFRSLFSDELNTLSELFTKHGYEIRIAGGAVRDLLLGKTPTDLDFATTATPSQMKQMFTEESVRMINMNGEKHGTITPRINDKTNFEVTTLRIDVVTDGRHAEVQFTTDWMLDALRRDLTINSMFLALDGSVYDYFYGYDDLMSHKVQFVGDATTRIQEDYLRILRYFRFYGRIAKEPDNHQASTLEAIKDNAKGLANISGERIWTELKKILEGPFAGELMTQIINCGIGPHIGLPLNPNLEELTTVWTRSQHHQLNAITLLSALLNDADDVIALNARLKLSAFERDLAVFVVEHRGPKTHPKPLVPYQKLVLKANKLSDGVSYVSQVLAYNNSPYLDEFKQWQVPKFPISGNMLKEAGVESGKFMGVVLNELKHYWAENEFNLSSDELLKKVPDIVERLPKRKRK